MSALYIHLPFCRSKCIYCDFYVDTHNTTEKRIRYMQALLADLQHQFSETPSDGLQSVYLGGGTPALFTAEELQQILEAVQRYAPLTPQAEITMEANPNDTASSLEAYRAIGINRLSIGIQSLQANELKRLSRLHSAQKAIEFVHLAERAGFYNISIDLMYGLPEQTLASWQDTLRQVVALPIQHISMYGLKVEPQTKLDTLVKTGRMSLADDDLSADCYELAVAFLAHHGLQRYEISNFCKPGLESRHNLTYWQNKPFYGVGVSAHGYLPPYRTAMARDLEAYLIDPAKASSITLVSDQEQLENAFIFGLRQASGVNVQILENLHSFCFSELYLPKLAHSIEAGLLLWDGITLKLTDRGILLNNLVAEAFLLDKSTV
jgi:oxygen-independent coproporphyrinogen III oxidase